MKVRLATSVHASAETSTALLVPASTGRTPLSLGEHDEASPAKPMKAMTKPLFIATIIGEAALRAKCLYGPTGIGQPSASHTRFAMRRVVAPLGFA